MDMRKRGLGVAAGLSVAAIFGAAGVCCEMAPDVSGPDSSTTSTTGDSGGAGGSAGLGKTGGLGGDLGVGGRSGTGGLDVCVATSAEATIVKKPVDIIFIIDNSGSMGDNIESVQDSINDDFASIIGASGIDYRVIMLSMHGNFIDERICVRVPLSTTDCNPVPVKPGQNPPIFYHYSIPIGSHDSICRALGSYDGSIHDAFGLFDGGWRDWLRKEALKIFVEVTDDGVQCMFGGLNYDDNDLENDGWLTAGMMDAAILALDPEQFGDATKRNYVWHSIVGLKESTPATAAYGPMDPVITESCITAMGNGTGYQALSRMTGGLRFPICEYGSFNVVFQDIAKGVIEGAKVACEFAVPEAPPGETIDMNTILVEYTPGGGDDKLTMTQVESAQSCQPSSFYIDESTIKLCPDACALVQADDQAKIEILFGCEQQAPK